MTDAPATDRTLDCKGLLCPMPIVKLSKMVKEMASGEVVVLEATDPGAVPDVIAWSKNTATRSSPRTRRARSCASGSARP